MLDTNQDFDVCSAELGNKYPVEQLITPLTRFSNQRPDHHFAIDNGAFSNFNAKGFRSLLEREKENRHLCRFVAVPDVVGSARRTLEVFEHWKNDLHKWPLALVCQDGQENLPIPWDEIAAIFIGGSTTWKLSTQAAQCIKAAKAIGKWVHVGRVNSPERLEYFEKLGADSIDGSGLARYSHMREKIGRYVPHPDLFEVAR